MRSGREAPSLGARAPASLNLAWRNEASEDYAWPEPRHQIPDEPDNGADAVGVNQGLPGSANARWQIDCDQPGGE